MSVRFTRIDNLTRGQHRFLDAEDDCSYIGEFTARKGYSHSETNNKIISLKMKPSIRITRPDRYRHKGNAITYWGNQLSAALPLADAEKAIWIPIPGSCPRGHLENDDRLIHVLRRAYGQRIRVGEFIEQSGERVAAHDSEQRPTPESLIERWATNFPNLPDVNPRFVVFDDVITRGASFKAAKRLLIDHYGKSTVIGLFLARTVHDDGPMFDFDILTDLDS